MEKIHLIRIRTCDLLACSLVPQSTALPRVGDKWMGACFINSLLVFYLPGAFLSFNRSRMLISSCAAVKYAGWSSGSALYLCPGGARFESRPEHWLL
jgi:hypothetical protein